MKNVLKRHRSKIMIILLSSILLGCSQEKMILKKEKFVVEYGQSISTKVSDYLDNKDNFLKDVKMTVDGQNEEGKTYLSIGQYKVSFTRNQKTVETTVEIVDTTAPEFKDLKESYKVNLNGKLDITQLKVTDLSKVTLAIDDSKVNYSKSGIYTANVIAKDESGNETRKDIKIVVEEKKKDPGSSSQSSQSNNSSKGSSSKNKSKSNSSSSSSSKIDESQPDKKNSIIVTPDSDSYQEFNNGNNYGWGGSFEWPDEWE
ncbi:hypothetical protein [Coprobacillus cateniformis]|uniref:hypothetical protein n=1 Tax=Coprobacillus cateniformis TaxID=100884 RepID=UPI0034A5D05F